MRILDENGNIGISNVNPHATKYQMPGELLKRLRDFFEVQSWLGVVISSAQSHDIYVCPFARLTANEPGIL